MTLCSFKISSANSTSAVGVASESSLALDEDIVEVVKVDEDGAGVVVSTYEVAELVNELTELVVGEVESEFY